MKVVAINEAKGKMFTNATSDQFPYIESALNSLDNNFKWWKESWPEIETMIEQYTKAAMKKKDEFSTTGTDAVKITSRFTMFHGHDEKAKDVIWSGPAVVYTIEGVSPAIVKKVKDEFGGLYKGRKIFAEENQLIFLFG
jgi:hypothetical protein